MPPNPELALDFKGNLGLVLIKNKEIDVARWFPDEHRKFCITSRAIVVANGDTALGWSVAVY